MSHKLPPVPGIHFPVPLHQKDGSHMDIKKIPDKRHKVGIPLDTHLQDGISVVRILIWRRNTCQARMNFIL